MKFSDIVNQLSPENHSLNDNPNLDPEVVCITRIQEAIAHSLSYIEGDKFARLLATTSASALILPSDKNLQEEATHRGIAWLSSSYPRLTFAQAIELFYQPYQPETKIHPKAVIADGVIIGKNVAIGANAVISEGVKLGDDVVIHPNVVVYPECVVGDRTELHSNCSIHERTQIGADCVIHSGAVIGAEGFGFVPVPQGWYKMPQSGYVILEDRVEIGCNSTVDRPALGTTKIGENTKLDNLVHVGHNCQIGKSCAFAGQVGLAGGVEIGNRVILGGQVGVANQATIGDGASASAQTGISSNVKAGDVVSGTPSMPHHIYLKLAAIYKHIPDMYKSYRDLKRKNHK
ncbi:MAG: UDP-3-O-(3-hydroxymyristoyl)glucosamine N-acyltransferase [Cyanobacterium sp.]